MSAGVSAAVGTVFSSVATTVSNVGSAVMGVGSSLFTAGAAGATGALSGTLGNIVKGALTQGAIGALVGGGISAMTGGGFGRGALMGGLGGALSGGLMGAAGLGTNPFADGFGQAQTPTGVQPTGSTAGISGNARQFGDFGSQINGVVGGPQYVGPQAVAGGYNTGGSFATTNQGWSSGANAPIVAAGGTGPTTPLVSGVSKNVMGGGESGGGLLSGIFKDGHVIKGAMEGVGGYFKMKAEKEQQEKLIAAQLQRAQMEIDEREREQRRKTAGYRIGPEGYHGAAQDSGAGRPPPSTKYARYVYDGNRVVRYDGTA